MRLANPVAISFDEATANAVIGLAVNLLSAWLLRDEYDHPQLMSMRPMTMITAITTITTIIDGLLIPARRSSASFDGLRAGIVFSLRAAATPILRADTGENFRWHIPVRTLARRYYLHVIADAMTSVLAIVALMAGRFCGWVWMDPVTGIVGAVLITHWSITLMRSSGAVLLDVVPDPRIAGRIKERLEIDGDRVADLHLWRLGPGHARLIAAVVSDRPEAPMVYKERLVGLAGLSHVTIEVHACAHAEVSVIPASG